MPTTDGVSSLYRHPDEKKPVTREEKRFLDSQLLSSAYDPEKLLDGVSEFWQPLRGLPQCQLRRAGVAQYPRDSVRTDESPDSDGYFDDLCWDHENARVPLRF